MPTASTALDDLLHRRFVGVYIVPNPRRGLARAIALIPRAQIFKVKVRAPSTLMHKNQGRHHAQIGLYIFTYVTVTEINLLSQ